MVSSGGWQQVVPNLVIDATISGSLLILLALSLAHFWAKAAAARRHLLWRLVTVGLTLSLVAAALPRMHLGWLPASSALTWGAPSTQPTVDFHELNTLAPLAAPGQNRGFWGAMGQMLNGSGWLCIFWLLGMLFFLGRLGLDVHKLKLLARKSKPLDLDLEDSRFSTFIKKTKDRYPAQLLLANCEVTPMSWGWYRPKILLPKTAENWTTERRELVLLHEWGHILQKDFPFLVLSRLLNAVFWFNPLVWMATKQLARTREQACDDFVLGTGVKASTYADHLFEIARSIRGCTHLGHASLSMARLSELEGRLMAILDRGLPRGVGGGNRAIRWPIAGLLLMAPLLAVTPWRAAVTTTINQDDLSCLAVLDFSDEEWQLLEKKGVSASFLKRLIGFGYRHLDVEKILYLREAGVEEGHVVRQANLIYEPLTLVRERARVCMRADALTERPNMALEIEDKTYYALPRCSLLMHRRGFRVAVDPISGKRVDKALAVIGAAPNNQVFYFENEANLKAFNACQ